MVKNTDNSPHLYGIYIWVEEIDEKKNKQNKLFAYSSQ